MNKNITNTKGKIDWMITLVPLGIVIALCILFFLLPDQSNAVLSQIRFFFGDTFGTYYLVIGLGIFLLSLYIAGSKYGDIVLGEKGEKPKYSFFSWGAMMFTCGLAADILFYSFSEWVLYATDPHLEEMGSIQEWAGVYPLFHWSFIPWGFYLVLAVAFGFMLHVRKRNRQKYSEACRPILGKHTDGWAGRIIDLLAVFALLAGTATTFSVATPLMATIIGELFHITVSRTVINAIIFTGNMCCIYIFFCSTDFKGISRLANICIYLFFGLLAVVLLFGGETLLYHRDRSEFTGNHGSELYRSFYLYGSSENLKLCHRTGRFITGHTGWSGVWQHRFSSVASPVEEPSARLFWEVMVSALDPL